MLNCHHLMTSSGDILSTTSPRRLVATLMFAGLTVSVMSTLGAPLIPTIAHDFGVSLSSAQWILTVNLLVGVIATPVLGRLGDGPRRGRVLQITLLSSLLGSVVAATAQGLPQLLVGRAMQGVGYATVPLAISMARTWLSGPRQTSAIAALSVTVAVGAGLGFPVTALIAQGLGFHAAFWFGAIFSALALVTVWVVVPRAPAGSRGVRLDIPGAALLGIGLGALLIALTEGERLGWESPEIAGLLLVTVTALAVWARVELRSANPLIDLRSSVQPAVLGANSAALLLGIGLYTCMSLINILTQMPRSTGYGFGSTLVTAGLLLLPLSIGSLISQPISRRLVARFGIARVLPMGAVLVATTQILLAVFHGGLWEIGLATGLLGFGIGVTFATMPALIVSAVPASRTASAISLNQVLRTTGGSIGSALCAMALAAHTPVGALHPEAAGITMALMIGAGACLVAAALALVLMRLQPTGPRELSTEESNLLMEEGGAGGGVGPSVFDGEEMTEPVRA